jgi:hypothetical protein
MCVHRATTGVASQLPGFISPVFDTPEQEGQQTMNVTATVVELPDNMRGNPMMRQANRSLMMEFINDDLAQRSYLDTVRSIVFYDAEGIFELALANLPNAVVLDRLYAAGVRYWSRGIA